ncbi:MAG: hypothetical protein FWD23_03195 [Oscillospiraceae bacterium]|nr:hypothetical protein [Oscillospiraceae bacterium]
MADIFKVENPVYQDTKELLEQYDGNWVIMHSRNNKKHGLVIYYSPDGRELDKKIMELDKESDMYHDYNVRYIGKQRSINASGGLFL